MTAGGWKPSLGAWLESDGARFRVWAPESTSVELVIEGRDDGPPLGPEEDGYWVATVPGLEAGLLYGYRLDGEGPYPDPAARSQPLGVHGLSELVDPEVFPWTDEAWRGPQLEDQVFYEIHVGTFSPEGTFDGVIERLPDLRDLGVTALQLMPVAAFPGRWNWGYDGVALFAPAREYGGPEALRRLVDRAHLEGLAVLLDVVYNHTGPDGSYLEQYSPHYLSRTHRTPWGPGVNLDGSRAGPVRQLFIENARHWIAEYHLDGLRLDACRALVDTSPRHLLAEMQARVREVAEPRRVLMIAEDSRNLVDVVRPEAQGGWGFDGIWADDLHHQLRVAAAGDRDGYYRDFEGSLEDVARTLNDGWFFQGQHSEHFDGPRGTDPTPAPPRHFVVYLQNHDQVGNRAQGDRLHHGIDAARWRALSVLALLGPETPLLFMGQEWGASTPFQFFTDHGGALGRRVSGGRRRELQAFSAFSAAGKHSIPDPQDEETFRRSRLDWSERSVDSHARCLRLTRTLLALRAELRLGRLDRWEYRVLVEDDSLVLKLQRMDSPEVRVIVCLDPNGLQADEALTSEALPGWRVLLSTEDDPFAPDPQPPSVTVAGEVPRVEFARAGAVVVARVPASDGGHSEGAMRRPW